MSDKIEGIQPTNPSSLPATSKHPKSKKADASKANQTNTQPIKNTKMTDDQKTKCEETIKKLKEDCRQSVERQAQLQQQHEELL